LPLNRIPNRTIRKLPVSELTREVFSSIIENDIRSITTDRYRARLADSCGLHTAPIVVAVLCGSWPCARHCDQVLRERPWPPQLQFVFDSAADDAKTYLLKSKHGSAEQFAYTFGFAAFILHLQVPSAVVPPGTVDQAGILSPEIQETPGIVVWILLLLSTTVRLQEAQDGCEYSVCAAHFGM
jgi:hypothetical protein